MLRVTVWYDNDEHAMFKAESFRAYSVAHNRIATLINLVPAGQKIVKSVDIHRVETRVYSE